MRGTFLSIEGLDGSGKSTLASTLSDYLIKNCGCNVVLTREPGGNLLAEKIRNLLLDPKNDIVPEAEALLYAAARAQHVKTVIMPALERGNVVISDRFIDSSIAYQCFGRGLDYRLVLEANRLATGGLEPDLTLLLDLEVELGLQRVFLKKKDKDRIEKEAISFYRYVRRGYLEQARRYPERICVIDAGRDIDIVSREAKNLVLSFLKKRCVL